MYLVYHNIYNNIIITLTHSGGLLYLGKEGKGTESPAQYRNLLKGECFIDLIPQ